MGSLNVGSKSNRKQTYTDSKKKDSNRNYQQTWSRNCRVMLMESDSYWQRKHCPLHFLQVKVVKCYAKQKYITFKAATPQKRNKNTIINTLKSHSLISLFCVTTESKSARLWALLFSVFFCCEALSICWRWHDTLQIRRLITWTERVTPPSLKHFFFFNLYVTCALFYHDSCRYNVDQICNHKTDKTGKKADDQVSVMHHSLIKPVSGGCRESTKHAQMWIKSTKNNRSICFFH